MGTILWHHLSWRIRSSIGRNSERQEAMGVRSRLDRCGRRLSYVLRHHPESAGVSLAYGGWADVTSILEGMGWDRDLLVAVVSADSKGRYEFSADGSFIRALHGHSADVDLGYDLVTPPDVLYHGTAEKTVGSILSDGILPMGRQFVHLSGCVGDALSIGARHGRPAVLSVDAKGMFDAGYGFHLSGDGVWLTPVVPARFLSV